MQSSRIHGSSRTTPFDMWAAISQSYRVLCDITCGRDGTIIKKAQQIATGDIVTLKVMPVRDEERRTSCRREAELLSCVSHRNILSFFESFECSTDFVLVTEFCPGGDLLDVVNNGGKFSEADARAYMRQLLSAMQYLLARGIAHRDVKLDNIFIAENGEVKLGDFGFARRFYAGERFNTSCGTLVYVAPELLVPKPDYDPIPAEIYSLGVTLFAMCAAYLPYDSLDEQQVIAEVRKGGRAMPSFFSPALASLVTRMIAVSPSARPTLAQVRDSEWLAPDEHFTRSYSHPGMRAVAVRAEPESRPRSQSVPDSAVDDFLPTSPALDIANLRISELPVTRQHDAHHAAATNEGKRQSWLYRKLVKPLAARWRGGGSQVSAAHA